MTAVNHRNRTVSCLFGGAALLCLIATNASAELGDVVGLTLGPANTGTFGSTVHVMPGNRLVVPDRANNIYVYDANRSLINTLTTPDPVIRGFGFGFGTSPMGQYLLASDFVDPNNPVTDPYGSLSFDTPQQVHILDIDTGQPVRSLSSPGLWDEFGSSVSYQPGSSKIFVGAFLDGRTPGGSFPIVGAAHAFDVDSDTGGYSLTTAPQPDLEQERASFGFSIASSRQTLAVSEPHAARHPFQHSLSLVPLPDPYAIFPVSPLPEQDFAEVHLYDAPTGEYFRSIPTPNVGQGYADLFGTQLATTDKTVYISAIEDRTLGVGVGAVYAYDVQTGTLQQQFLPTGARGSTLFGWATKVYGDYLFVGAPEYESGSDFLGNPIWTDSGAVFIYNRRTGELVKTIENPTPNDGDNFGRAIDVVGTRLYVGAPFDDSGGNNAGAVHEFDLGNLPYTFSIADGLDSASAEFLGGSFTPGGLDVTVGGLNGPGEVSGELVPGMLGGLTPFTTPDGDPAMWSLAFTGVASDFALTFGYDDTGLGSDEARLVLWQFLGQDLATDPSNWVLLSLADPNSNTITVQTSSLGTFALGIQPVPEPATILLLLPGFLLGINRKQKKVREQ